MTITYHDETATFTEGVWHSTNDALAYWLQTAFPTPTVEDLEAHGLFATPPVPLPAD